MTLRNIFLERREETRKVPEQFAFLQLDHDDGGKVLDISEGGLRFESFSPLREHDPIHFWFSLNLRERIEGWGELAWTEAGGKSGGLKFLRLSEGGHDRLREYLARPSPSKVPSSAGGHDSDAVSTFASKATPHLSLFPSARKGAGAVSIPFPASLETTIAGHLVPLQRHLAAMRRQLLIGLLIGAGVAGSVTFAAFKFSQYLHERRPAAKPTLQVPAQKDPGAGSPTIAAPAADTSPKDIFAIGSPRKVTATPQSPLPLPVNPTGHPARAKTPLTPDQLWALVQAGNSTAAAALAELYIKGDGVPQSCAQARVLLLVASEKRNAAAIKRLADLDRGGCPAN